jgi:pyruvate,water dikinase
MSDLRAFDAVGPADRDAVGGKGLSLGLLAQAGLPVPPGFCVTSAVHCRLRNRPLQSDAGLAAQIAGAYHRLGGGLVAVRSSATAEDGAVTSFAGQQETILGVSGEQAVLDAVARCWASLDSERAVAYRRRLGVEAGNLAMAVVVQRLVPAEVSGVLFTRDPLDPEGRRMLVEASWGLGESVVSGRVTPDRFHLDRETGAVVDRHIHVKPTRLTAAGLQDVPHQQQNQACLDDGRLAELADLGRRVEAFYGDARDVEWAWAEGRFWLLQARPITTAPAASDQVRREEIAALAARAAPGGTVWSRFNLAEVLPEPTPMTWAIVGRLLSGRGGFGRMYRDFGFRPDPSLDTEGVYDLVCGRPYCNLSREPRMYAGYLPLAHSFAALKADPRKAHYPRAQPDLANAGWRFWLLLPVHFLQAVGLLLRLQRLRQRTAAHLRDEVFPTFAAETAAGAAEDLTRLETPALLERLEHWTQRTLMEFARDSLKPTVLAAHSMNALEQVLTNYLGAERARAAVGELIMGVRPEREADLAAAVRSLAEGSLTRVEFLERFGHRGSQEMELAQPRWAEDPNGWERLAAATSLGPEEEPDVTVVWERIATQAGLKPALRSALAKEAQALHTYLGLREAAKHYFMKGYALIRCCLLEVDRRYHLGGGGIFYLTPEELPHLAAGTDLSSLIASRRRRRTLALNLPVPPVLFSDDLDAIGRPEVAASSDTLQGVPLSAGVAEGPALVLEKPTQAQLPAEPYVLVCPSTDPAWVPLFVNARALVMETGGVLSHGAIVAREFGLPAVAGLAGVHRRLKTGQRLRVDGACGTVAILLADRAEPR